MRESWERRATTLFVGYLLAMAIICGAVIVSGWFAGVLDDPPERVFWLGSVLAFATVVTFAIAAFPGGADDVREIARIRRTVRVGLVLAVLSPALCIGALIADFYG
jgi:ABC-type multidrug transport system permease subunit